MPRQEMNQPRWSRSFATLLLPLVLTQCSPLNAELAALTLRVKTLEKQQREQLPLLSRRIGDLEKDLHRSFSEARCQKLDSVRALMEALQSSTCQPESYTNALRQMQNLPHVLAYFSPEASADSMHDERLLAMVKLYDRPLYSWTSLLIVTLPPNNALADRAQEIAGQLLVKAIEYEGDRKVHHLPPTAIKCTRGNKSVASLYAQRPADAPKKGEPKTDQAIMAWMFLLDC